MYDLQKIRVDRGLYLEDVCRHMRCSRSHLSRIERRDNNTRGNYDFMRRLAEYYGINTDQLLLQYGHTPRWLVDAASAGVLHIDRCDSPGRVAIIAIPDTHK